MCGFAVFYWFADNLLLTFAAKNVSTLLTNCHGYMRKGRNNCMFGFWKSETEADADGIWSVVSLGSEQV